MSHDSSLKQRRIDLVRRHAEAENTQDIDTLIATFEVPRYEFVGRGVKADGEGAVRALWETQYQELSDFRVDIERIGYGDDVVFAEVSVSGDHTGDFMNVPPTGNRLAWKAVCVFEFDGELLKRELVYSNPGAILEQMGQTQE